MDIKKVVLKLYLHDDRDRQKAMKAVSSLLGVESIAIDLTTQQLSVIGDVDPVAMVNKLRKKCRADILSVGPVAEPQMFAGETQNMETQMVVS